MDYTAEEIEFLEEYYDNQFDVYANDWEDYPVSYDT